MTFRPHRLADQLHIAGNDSGRAPQQSARHGADDSRTPASGIPSTDDIALARALYGPMLTFGADKIIGHSLRTTGAFQEAKIREVSQFLVRKYAFQPETFVDIGANIGTHLVFALNAAGYQEGFGIEPDVNNYRLLVCNVLLNGLEGRTSLFNLAFSDEDGWAELELSTENFGDHRIRNSGGECAVSFGEDERKSYRVPKTHAGRWLTNAMLNPRSTLVWIDTQGHEGHVFRCFLGEQPCVPPPYLVAEFWPYGLERAGGKKSYLAFLAQCVAVYDINAENWEEASPVPIDLLSAMYDQMLVDTTATHYPHTDLLCISGN